MLVAYAAAISRGNSRTLRYLGSLRQGAWSMSHVGEMEAQCCAGRTRCTPGSVVSAGALAYLARWAFFGLVDITSRRSHGWQIIIHVVWPCASRSFPKVVSSVCAFLSHLFSRCRSSGRAGAPLSTAKHAATFPCLLRNRHASATLRRLTSKFLSLTQKSSESTPVL